MCPGFAATAASIRQEPTVEETFGLMETLKMELSELEREALSLRQSEKGIRDVFMPGESLEKV